MKGHLPSPIQNYPGAKGGAGVYQRIINKVPDFDKIRIPFLGSGQIFIRLDHSRSDVVVNDCSGDIVTAWLKSAWSVEAVICNYDYRRFLEVYDTGDCFFYLDPPYLLETRNNNKYYKYEFNTQDHLDLLEWATKTTSKFLISHPRCKLYNDALKPLCSVEDFDYTTRQGQKQDALWFNYDPCTVALNNYTYHGDNRTRRQQIKRQASRISQKLNQFDFHTRQNLLRQINAAFGHELT